MAVWQGYLGYVLLVAVGLLILRKRYPLTEHHVGKLVVSILMGAGAWRIYEYVSEAGSALNMSGLLLIFFLTFVGGGFYWWHTRPARGESV